MKVSTNPQSALQCIDNRGVVTAGIVHISGTYTYATLRLPLLTRQVVRNPQNATAASGCLPGTISLTPRILAARSSRPSRRLTLSTLSKYPHAKSTFRTNLKGLETRLAAALPSQERSLRLTGCIGTSRATRRQRFCVGCGPTSRRPTHCGIVADVLHGTPTKRLTGTTQERHLILSGSTCTGS